MLKRNAICLALLLNACTVGPDYVRPTERLPTQLDGAELAQYQQAPVHSELMQSFQRPELDALIALALRNNTTIAQALARLDEARALRGLTRFSWFPTVTSSGGRTRSKPSALDPQIPPDVANTTSSYELNFDAAWEIDLFGSLRRQSEAVWLRSQAARAALANVQQAIVAETAQSYFSLLGARERLRITIENVANLTENDRILELRLEAGRGTALDLARARALGLGVAAQIPQLEAEINAHEQRLAVLTAQPVASLRAQLNPKLALPALPELVAIGTPEAWLKRRPDIQNAERTYAAANADVGVQVAEYFPKVNLLGTFGSTTQSFSDLGVRAGERYRFGPQLNWQFLNFGRVGQFVSAAEARAEGARAAYRETVLRALEEVQNALFRYATSNATVATLSEAQAQAAQARELAQLRFDAGASDLLVVLDVERAKLDLDDRLVQAQTARATALVVLYKALAGDFAGLAKSDTAQPLPTSEP